MSLAPSHASAVAASHYTTVEAVQIKLPNKTLNLLSGAGVASFIVGTAMTTFVGSDPEFGKLGSIGQVSLSMDAASPAWKFSLMPNSPAALAVLGSGSQGSVVQYWTLVINPANGAVINAHQLWFGLIDTATITLSVSGLRADFDVLTATELLMAANEGERLTPAWQQLHFPGQTGLRFNVDAKDQPFWGQDALTSNPTSSNTFKFTGGIGGIIQQVASQQR
jgi:hypothetical protein